MSAQERLNARLSMVMFGIDRKFITETMKADDTISAAISDPYLRLQARRVELAASQAVNQGKARTGELVGNLHFAMLTPAFAEMITYLESRVFYQKQKSFRTYGPRTPYMIRWDGQTKAFKFA